MEILNLNTNDINQNGYHFNKITKNKIGMIFTAPVDYVPDDCLACDGYVLKISDYKKLYSIIKTKFNDGTEAEDEFRIPDYNITKLFLQAGSGAGTKIAASLPQHTHSGTTSSNGAHTHTRGTMDINGTVGCITDIAPYVTGVFTYSASGNNNNVLDTASSTLRGALSFTASRNWTGATSSNGAHTHTMTVGSASNSFYKENSTVQPPSQIVHLCIKYK